MNPLSGRPPVCVIGSVLPDLHFAVDRLPPSGGDVLARSYSLRLGGSAWLVATALKELGVECVVVLRRGTGPLDRFVRNAIAREGIAVRGRVARAPGGVTVTLVEGDGERSLVSAFGAEDGISAEDLRRARVAQADVVYVSGYEVAQSVELDRAIGALPRTVRVVFDPGPRAIRPGAAEGAWQRADVVRLNLLEAQARTGHRGADAARALGEGRAAVVSTRVGAYLAVEGAVAEIVGGEPIQGDTTGAGDAHAAGLIAGLVQGLQLATAVELANGTARRRVLGSLGPDV